MDLVTPNQPVAVTLDADTDDACGVFLAPGEVWDAASRVVTEFPQFFEEVGVNNDESAGVKPKKKGPGRPKKTAAKVAD